MAEEASTFTTFGAIHKLHDGQWTHQVLAVDQCLYLIELLKGDAVNRVDIYLDKQKARRCRVSWDIHNGVPRLLSELWP